MAENESKQLRVSAPARKNIHLTIFVVLMGFGLLFFMPWKPIQEVHDIPALSIFTGTGLSSTDHVAQEWLSSREDAVKVDFEQFSKFEFDGVLVLIDELDGSHFLDLTLVGKQGESPIIYATEQLSPGFPNEITYKAVGWRIAHTRLVVDYEADIVSAMLVGILMLIVVGIFIKFIDDVLM